MRQSTFDKRLKLLISHYEINQKQLSDMTGIREQTISNYCTAHRDPKIEMLVKISETFNVDPSWLLGYGSDDKIERIGGNYGNI